MPKPAESSYPKEKRWRFVQRYITDSEILKFSALIERLDGRIIDEILPELLSFVKTGKVGLKKGWLDIWVNVMHQMGLGYTSGNGKFLHSTDFSSFITQTRDLRSFYYYWALKFQYPFGFPKQLHYIINKVSIQPIVLILQHLIKLWDITDDPKQAYLTKDEIVLFLMRSKDHFTVPKNCAKIIANRTRNYDYALEERTMPGFNEAGEHLFSRGKLYLNKVDLLIFKENRILISDANHKKRIEALLSYWKPPIVFTKNTQDMRNLYFDSAYNHLDPYPSELVNAVDTVKSFKPSIPGIPVARTKPLERPKEADQIENPSLLKGTFSKRQIESRTFQTQLRKDLMTLYKSKCAICGLSKTEFLRAAHIIPVRIDPEIAADRTNCILLCVLHDVAMEYGYIGISDTYKLIVSSKIKKSISPLLKRELIEKEGISLFRPSKLKPKQEYLLRHREIHDLS